MTSEPLSPSSTQPTASHCANTLFKSFYPNANAEAPQNERLAYGHRETIFGLAFSPDGKYLASASQDSTVRVWEVRTHRLLETLGGDADFECLRVAWCPAICDDNNGTDGEQRYLLATAGADGILRLYSASLQKDKLIWKLVGSKDHYQLLNKTTQDRPQIYSLQFVPGPSTNDSSTTDWLLMTSADDAIFLWDVQNQDIISHSILQFGQLGQNQFGGARNPDNAIYIFDAACNNNSLVAVALSDGTCRVLNLFKMQEKQCVLSVPEELVGEKGGHLTALAWDSKGERLVTCIACGKVALWNIQFHSGTILSSFVAILEGGHEAMRPLFGAKYYGHKHEELLLTWGVDGKVCVWDSHSRGMVTSPIGTLISNSSYPIYALDCIQNRTTSGSYGCFAIAGGSDGGFLGVPVYLYDI